MRMRILSVCLSGLLLAGCGGRSDSREPVDYVNPYMGNISHLLVPTYPTVHLPNSLLRVYPERGDYTSNSVAGLPVVVTSHRGSSAFNLSPVQGDAAGGPVVRYTYDDEIVRPYYYSVYLDEAQVGAEFAPSHQSAVYALRFEKDGAPGLILNSRDGALQVAGNVVEGYQRIGGSKTNIYLYLQTDRVPVRAGALRDGKADPEQAQATGRDAALRLDFADSVRRIGIRYGISLISTEQARRNLEREIDGFDVGETAVRGRELWNDKLGKIRVRGGSENDRTVFYTSLYRTYERMVCLSEDGRYYSAFDGRVHDDEGVPFYTDDWIWDTYRATHPLRTIIEPETEGDMIASFVRMAEQMPEPWMPTFPEVTGDSRRMNSNHGVATVADAMAKGLGGFDAEKAYAVCKGAITEKTLAPWSGAKGGRLDEFFRKEGYFPALRPGETESVPEVHPFEKRQPVAVTLGTVYDQWCLGRIAQMLGKRQDAEYFAQRSLDYRKIFNPETRFFHPKDEQGRFIEPFDYVTSGGLGAREAYGENNGWVYRWDVPHNIADLVALMGGPEAFSQCLDDMYDMPLGNAKFLFYAQLPDHTGNVGQFSMANEPSLHIPYLYNYAGQPWKTQKRIRTLLAQWFRNDLMGVPGDEDGGGMSAFVVFSMLGFYPVTPGLPIYAIGSPVFERATVALPGGATFEVVCHNYAPGNKYIQSARLNGREIDRSWFSHSELSGGGRLELTMGPRANRDWACGPDAVPPSFGME